MTRRHRSKLRARTDAVNSRSSATPIDALDQIIGPHDDVAPELGPTPPLLVLQPKKETTDDTTPTPTS
jgi:hypothetical protein